MAKSKAKILTQELLTQAKLGQELKLRNEDTISHSIINQMCWFLLMAHKKVVDNNLMSILCYLDKISDFKINFKKEKIPYLVLALKMDCGIEALKWFIKRGSDVNCTQSDGISALFYPIKHNDIEAVRLLLKHKIKLNTKHIYNPVYGLFFNQDTKNKKEITQLLIDAGMKINEPENKTILQMECERANNREFVHFLLTLGANPTLKNEMKECAISIAIIGNKFSSAINTDYGNLQVMIDYQAPSQKLEFLNLAINVAQNIKLHKKIAVPYLEEQRIILLEKMNLEKEVNVKKANGDDKTQETENHQKELATKIKANKI